mmetsp:Transcript_26137/g.67549  ORF Transcript_26137/g.67549 Transcript_26137/m.67549 type:complete len:145 (-) Transcript_26137:310-744(-)
MADEVSKRADEIYESLADKHICNLKTLEATFGGDKTMMGRGVTMFLSTNRDVSEKVGAQLAAREYADLRRTVHTCKGSAGFVGAERVKEIAFNLQNSSQELAEKQKEAEDKTSVEAPVEVKAQAAALARCVAELLAELDKLPTS